MHYQDKEKPGSVGSTWNQVINTLVLWSPALFGCNRVTLKEVVTPKEFDNLSAVMQKLGAVKVAEAHDPTGKSLHHYFRVEGKPIILIFQEKKPVDVIAPKPLLEYIQTELKNVLH